MSVTNLVIFSHGLDSSPRSAKISALAQCAHELGFATEALDYQGLEPLDRVAKLLAFGRTLSAPPILVGSSLGGHVAAAASIELKARGLFLMAPAFYMPGFEQYTPKPSECPISIVHGWRDAVVPVANSIRYARDYRATLQVLDADHRMLAHMTALQAYFRQFLQGLLADARVNQ